MSFIETQLDDFRRLRKTIIFTLNIATFSLFRRDDCNFLSNSISVFERKCTKEVENKLSKQIRQQSVQIVFNL